MVLREEDTFQKCDYVREGLFNLNKPVIHFLEVHAILLSSVEINNNIRLRKTLYFEMDRFVFQHKRYNAKLRP